MAPQEVSLGPQDTLGLGKKNLLTDLPEDCVLEILYYLNVIEILHFRSTCHRIYKISENHSVWLSAFHHTSDSFRIPLSLDRPLSSYPAAELQKNVTRFARVDRNWTKTGPAPTSTHELAWPAEAREPGILRDRTEKLILKGRWLLIVKRYGSVFSVDLDAPILSSNLLIPQAEGYPQKWYEIRTTVVESECADSEFLSFDVAFCCQGLANHYEAFPIRVDLWRISFNPTSNNLSAQHISSFIGLGPVEHPALRGNLICWAGSYGMSPFVRVFDWERSSLDVAWTCAVNYASGELRPEGIHIIPNNRLLVLHRRLMVILDIPKLESHSLSEPPAPTNATQLWTFDYTQWGTNHRLQRLGVGGPSPTISHPTPWTNIHNRHLVTSEFERYLHVFMIHSDATVTVTFHSLCIKQHSNNWNFSTGFPGVCRSIWKSQLQGFHTRGVLVLEDMRNFKPWSTMSFLQATRKGVTVSDHCIGMGEVRTFDLPGYDRDAKYFQFDELYGRIAFYLADTGLLRILDFA